ncbi:type I restriction-modification system subunit M [Pseudoalteromonas shioyasakiensis]|uniref:site-specific DNA-methyltransferase (adenine-specific) n=1 Tax=Pseudoalteromonas shioyasakiensis TaxID=1190813 RepID=A0ABT6TUM8_9GAMM|nr:MULTISPECIES: class I SAM-dependent DNA methyltransferase [Pseudoalteromonas]MDI4667618.1 type I restriction-modification system subunit M [Pseudoalteromonas shioyasakiensis]MDI4673151.1 type I restriction-modification system subunit M [Pseudoalteromonas shioyasakiensis]MDI4685216.1 type I restriction-modification system subunit M [Pseudoalteromonas shioyasakiensis]MDI4705057.1 type I restriction-modification system subunit M [Pseudoalteromonas shioyasakiensis]NUJ20552.1 SAM-dependent DNA m
MTNNNFSSTAAFLWSVADLLRGDFKQSQYGRIILPFTLLRRLECVLEATKPAVLAKYESVKAMPLEAQDKLLTHAAGLSFYNTSKMDLNRLGETGVASNLESYIQSFSPNAREIFEHFDFFNTIDKLQEADLLYNVVKHFRKEDLHPNAISNYGMGLVFEELIRRFAESSNETAGEHFTPRDIVELTTSLLFTNEDDLTSSGLVRSIYDPTAGTGGFLSTGMEYVHNLNEKASLSAFGQELNPESYAICKADMLIKGQKVDNIKLGNTLSNDQLRNEKFDYMLSNPPFGVDWKKIQKHINDEHKDKGFEGRFGPGLPRVSDGSLLFLMHLISKMRPENEGGSRIGIILNGSPLFTGGAGSGESEIRRYILESDLLEAIVALPTDMFYNTGIATYVWVLSSHKPANRKGKVQLINASKERAKAGGRGRSGGGEVEGNDENVFYAAMRKSLGSKRKELTPEAINTIVQTYGQFAANDFSKIFDYKEFGYRRITIERPLQLAIYPKDELRLEALQADNAWGKMDETTQQTILDALSSFEQEKYLSRDKFLKQLKAKLERESAEKAVKLSAVQLKLIVKHLGEHDDEAEVCKSKGQIDANPDLRDNENVPLTETVADYFAREVLPHVPDAWIDESKTDPKDGEVGIVGYEIPFNRHFYVYEPPRALEEIDADLDAVSADIMQLLQEVHS